MGDDSTPRTVLSLHRGKGKLYEVNQNKGDTYIVNEDHILTLHKLKNPSKYISKKGEIKYFNSESTIEDIPLRDWLNISNNKRKRVYRGIKAKLNFKDCPTVVNPYIFGLWLADGRKERFVFSVNNKDIEIREYLDKYAKCNRYAVLERNIQKESKDIWLKKDNCNFINFIKINNVYNNKHIPLGLIKTEESFRLNLLAGIIDGDGCLYTNEKGTKSYIFSFGKKEVFNSVVLLCQSLGLGTRTTIRKRKRIRNHKIYTSFEIRVYGDIDKIPVKLKRKKAIKANKKKMNPLLSKIEVHYKEVGDYFGFELDGNNRYLHSDLTVMHNCGKSFTSRLSIVYCIVRLWCLKNPHKFFNLSRISALAVYLMCFSLNKARQLLLHDVLRILETSPKFHKVIFTDKIEPTQRAMGIEKIVWCSASIVGEVSFSNDIHICLGSNPMDIIGANIVMAVISEINFFIENAGVTEEDVWNVYTQTKDRIRGTVSKRYGSMIFLDSSARDRDSVIENYILSAAKDPTIFFRQYNRWDTMPWLFPIWRKSKKTFDVFMGDSVRRPQIIDDKFKYIPGDDRKTIKIPIDSYEAFKQNVYQSLQNIAGQPTSLENLFFPDMEYVAEKLFDDYLPNVTRPVEAPMSSKSDGLIMEQVRSVFMQQDISGKWELKRAPLAPRWVRVDLSDTSDRTGVSMCHPEIRDDGSIMCIFDFTFDIKPTKEGINLDAVKEFVVELYKKYHISVVGVSTDRYQSKFIEQAIKKDDKEYRLISVDTDKTPYMVYKSKVLNGNCKVGFYENLYNNLKSLIETKDKVDHTTIRRDSEKDKNIGLHAKDLADSQSGAVLHCFESIAMHQIRYNYDDITRQHEMMKRFSENNGVITSGEKAFLFENLMKHVENRNVGKSNKDMIKKVMSM